MLEGLFYPRGVVLIGISENPGKLGYRVAENMITSGYPGSLYFVNPRGGQIFDRPIFTDLEDLPDPIDLAVILIPARFVPETLEACGQRGIPFAIISSSGFKEVGKVGEALEKRSLEIAKRYGMRILGPNCIGILDTHLPLNTTFLPPPGPLPGEVAFLSHSGATCAAVIDWARSQGLGFSKVVSFGNQMDIHETEVLLSIGKDLKSSVITLYLESMGDGPSFVEIARTISEKKPILALKVGRSKRGYEAVASHTGALAGEDVAFDAAFERTGVIRAQSLQELLDWARALAWCPLPEGKRIAILTNAGGLGVIATDALVDQELEVADLGRDSVETLKGIFPPEANVNNPIDMLATAAPAEFAKGLSVLLRDEGVDGVLVILPPPPILHTADYARTIIPVIQATSKPVVISLMGGEILEGASDLFREARIPDYRFPERAASALGVLAKRAGQIGTQPLDPDVLEGIDTDRAKSILEKGSMGENGYIKPSMASEIVSAYGIKIPEGWVARSEDEAYQAAERIGYPVALKSNSAEIIHKSEVGAIILGLQDGDQVIQTYQQIMSDMRERSSRIVFDQVLVQQMVEGGQEVILGVIRDPQFGPLVMFGSGGVEIEGLKDVAFALAPLHRKEAEKLVAKTWAGQRLGGYRDIQPADREAVLDAILRIGQLVADFPQINELEINPLMVLPEGAGVLAVDVRMRIFMGYS
jgi:acetyl coenzyme A synthetase (ADP forming)-like protein